METYTFLREMADSWALLVLFCFFVGVGLFCLRPGSRKIHADTSRIPFRHEDRPMEDRT